MPTKQSHQSSKMRWIRVSFKLCLLIVIFGVIAIDWADGGRILRTWRRNGVGRRPYSPWSIFQRQYRYNRRPRIHHHQQHQHQHHQSHYNQVQDSKLNQESFPSSSSTTDNRRSMKDEASLLIPMSPGTPGVGLDWSPITSRGMRPFGNTVGRDPTFDYAPPTNERVKFLSETTQRRVGRRPPLLPPHPYPHPMSANRRRLSPYPPRRHNDFRYQWNRRKSQYTKQSPLFWKLLANRQKWRNQRRPLSPFFVNKPTPSTKGTSSHEAEVTPYIPNIVFFKHTDVIPGPNTNKNSTSSSTINMAGQNKNSTSNSTLTRPGKVSSVPLYDHLPTSPSEFIPINPKTTPFASKEYIFRVVELQTKNQSVSSSHQPTTAPSAIHLTKAPQYHSVPSPPYYETIISTVSTTTELGPVELLEPPKPIDHFDIKPPKPIDHFDISIDHSAEGSDHFLRVVVPGSPADENGLFPTTTSTTTSTTTTTTTTPSTTTVPIFALREIPAVVQEITTTIPEPSGGGSAERESVKKPSFQHLLPTYANSRKNSSLSSSFPTKSSKSGGSRERLGGASKEEMSTSIMITGIRSKVKEYKPNLLANFSQLIAFDKVITPIEALPTEKILIMSQRKSEPSISTESLLDVSTISPTSPTISSRSSDQHNHTSSSMTSSTSESISLINSHNSTSSSSPSPMEAFDPLKLIHSWFMKT